MPDATQSPSRRRVLAGAGALAAYAAANSGSPASALASTPHPAGRTRPNIVLVMADDFGYGDLGCYGQSRISTPHLDRMASEGVRFTNFYAAGPVCAPSRCSMLTGLHTGHCTVRANPRGDTEASALRPEDVTFAECLQSVGYRTACFGKWGFGPEEADQPSHPNERGFDEFFGYITHRHAHDYFPTYLWENDTRVELPENEDGQQQTFAPDLFADRAVQFVEENRDEPFLLFLSPNLPHFPNQVPSLGEYQDKPWTPGNKAHAAQITRLDAQVGRIVDRLTELGMAENTVVVFTGDNGPHEEGGGGYDPRFFDSNGSLRGYKRNVYEGGVRQPMIAWSPRILRRAAGQVHDGTWSLWDLYPTLTDLSGAVAPDDLDGTSMAAVLHGRPGPTESSEHLYWYRLVFYRLALANAVDQGRLLSVAEAVREGDWKAVRFAPGMDRYAPDEEWDVELYNLRDDEAETDNLAVDHPEITSAMVHLMRTSWSEPAFHRDSWSPEGLSVDTPAFLVAGESSRVTTTFTNHVQAAYTAVTLRLTVAEGWTAEPMSSPTFRTVPPGQSVRTVWSVTPAADAIGGADRALMRSEAEGLFKGRPHHDELEAPVRVAAPPPTQDSYLSDLAWISATNGWGPVERDMSNGPRGAGDGRKISLGGVTYEKGLGVHAHSEISYYLGGNCTRFTATVGVDDEVGRFGSVTFYVLADDEQVFATHVVNGSSAPLPVDVDLTGVDVLELVVTHARGTGNDHADWADARVLCR